MNFNNNNEIKQKAQGLDPYICPRNLDSVAALGNDNIYESLNIIAKRSNQISVDLKKELHAKLEEFASSTDSLEEIHENKEQIEISKFYERLPNPTIIALHEFFDDKIFFKYKDIPKEID